MKKKKNGALHIFGSDANFFLRRTQNAADVILFFLKDSFTFAFGRLCCVRAFSNNFEEKEPFQLKEA